jgi:hypothetical protein
MHRHYLSSLLLRSCCLALALIAQGCGKDRNTEERTQTASGTVTTASSLRVADVELGRGLGADKRVTDERDEFRVRDTIYASVVTEGSAASATLTARWTYEDGQVVDSTSRTIAPTGRATTEFHISKPSGWPKGRYTLQVLLDGQQVATEDFEVQ